MTTTDGSVHEPVVPGKWAAPAWLADAQPTEQAEAAVQAAAPADDGKASLEEVALRMQRIKASAAAVREAVTSEAANRAPTPAPMQPRAPEIPADLPMHTPPSGEYAPPSGEYAPSGGTVPAGSDEYVPGPPQDFPQSNPPMASGEFDARAPAGQSADDFGDSFLDDDDDDFGDDDFGDDDSMAGMSGFGEMAAPRPVPWRPILLGAAIVLAVGVVWFSDRIFPGDSAEQDQAAEKDGKDEEAKEDGEEIRSGALASTKEDPKQVVASADTTPGIGKPVEPEPTAGEPEADGKAPADGAAPEGTPPEGETSPEGEAPPTPPTPTAPSVPLDAAGQEKLGEARNLYQSAGGRSKKKLGQAAELIEEILATNPSQGDALLLKAQIQLERGDATASLETATLCTQVAANLADCWLTLGVLQQDAKQKDAAALAYERYLALAPEGKYAGDVRKQLSRLK